MTGGRIERRLAAILAMDLAGYSRLMEADESGTLAMLKSLRTEAIEPAVGAHRGRVVKTTGDGLLLEFPSAASAVECAIALQSAIAAATADAADDRRLRFRIGLTLGDVMIDGDDIYGDGVNIAARLEQMAEPGAILVSAALYNQLGGDLRGRFETLGERRLKNLSQPVQVYRLRASADSVATRASEGRRAASPPKEQEIRFCRTADGVTIAYSAVGSGSTLIKAANWLNHLEFDWISPVWRGLFEDLSRDHRLVRYDARGNGLSDWNVEDLSFEAMVRDLETVIAEVAVERFALLGISQGCAVSIAYAVEHPERVTHLVLHGGYAQGWRARGDPDEIRRREAMLALTESGWGTDHVAFRQIFSSLLFPDGNPDQLQWLNELQRVCTSPKNAVRLQDSFSRIDVVGLLPRVRVPTLVLHSRHDNVVPFEAGRRLASAIPGARLVPIESRNHLVLGHEPAWTRFIEEIRAFLAKPRAAGR